MRLRLALFATCMLACAALATPASADGKLARARDEASGRSDSGSRSSDSSSSHRESSQSARRSDSHDHDHDHHHHHRHRYHRACDDLSFFDTIGCAIFSCDCVREPPATYTEVEVIDLSETPQPTYSSYPYATPYSPYLLEPQLQVASTSTSLDAHLRAEHASGRPWAGQLSLDAGFLAGIGQSSLNMRVMMPGPFELAARNTLLWEPAQNDSSLFGSATLGVRVSQSRIALLRLFGGFAYFGTIYEMLPGGELGLSMDIFLGRPWVLSAGASIAFVGEVLAPQARVQLGYLFGRSEVFVGYQHLQIGSVDLSAPLLGTRIWL